MFFWFTRKLYLKWSKFLCNFIAWVCIEATLYQNHRSPLRFVTCKRGHIGKSLYHIEIRLKKCYLLFSVCVFCFFSLLVYTAVSARKGCLYCPLERLWRSLLAFSVFSLRVCLVHSHVTCLPVQGICWHLWCNARRSRWMGESPLSRIARDNIVNKDDATIYNNDENRDIS